MLGGRGVSQWRALAFKVCGEKLIWEGVWSYLEPMDSVRLRIASLECAREVWAAWRAFFHPDTEGTGR